VFYLKTRDSILLEEIAIAVKHGYDQPFKALDRIKRLIDQKPQTLAEYFEEKIAKRENLLVPILWTKNFHPITLDENHQNDAPLLLKTASEIYDSWKFNLNGMLLNEVTRQGNVIYVRWYENTAKPTLFVAVEE
jgi:hypothetical protein